MNIVTILNKSGLSCHTGKQPGKIIIRSLSLAFFFLLAGTISAANENKHIVPVVTFLLSSKDDTTFWKEALTADLDSLSSELLTNNQVQIRNGNLKVVVPSKDYEWNSAWGFANPNQNVLATENDQFYAASIGKMTLATLTMLFVEQGKIDLNDPINMYLPASTMTGLHTFNGTDYSGQITIKHLLNSTLLNQQLTVVR